MSSLRGLDEPSDGGTQTWLPWMIQAGAYTSTEPILDAVSRVKPLFVDLPQRDGLRSDSFEPGAWAAEDAGLTIEQQMALGGALIARTGVLDSDPQAWRRNELPPSWPGEVAGMLGVGRDVVDNALVANRAWYRERFGERADDRRYATWDRQPFDERPLIKLASGDLLVISPRSFESWITDGFYHRALASARTRKRVDGFLTHLGHVVEAYALELMEAAHPGARAPGTGVVHGDQPYTHPRSGTRRTPDIAIDRWHDLVLIEVTSGRLTRASLVEGRVTRDLDAKVVDKIRQLSKRIDDMIAGHFAIDGVTLGDVRRIWPVVVAPGRLLQHPLLWDYIDQATAGSLRQPRVQPMTLLDLADLETLAGLLDEGHDLVEILRRKTAPPYTRMDFRKMVCDDPSMNATARASIVVARSDEMFAAIGTAFGLSSAEIARAAAETA